MLPFLEIYDIKIENIIPSVYQIIWKYRDINNVIWDERR